MDDPQMRVERVPSIFGGPEFDRLIARAEKMDRELADILTPEAKARFDAALDGLTRRYIEGS